MKRISIIITIFILGIPLVMKAELKEIPFTLDDRDRIIRTEQKVEALDVKVGLKTDALDNKIDTKFDGLRLEMNARFDQLFNFLWAIIGIFTTMMVSVFGFAFWDRKLSLAPLKRENERTLMVLGE